jgi:phospholipid/cholesterol/gamma-HCH transport system permease protein
MPKVRREEDERLDTVWEATTCRIKLRGDWLLATGRPRWALPPAGTGGPPAAIVIDARELGRWDGSLVLFLAEVRRTAAECGARLRGEHLPPGLPALENTGTAAPAAPRMMLPLRWIEFVGVVTKKALSDGRDCARFVGNCVFAVGRALRHPRALRPRDYFEQMQLCGAHGLPIVGLISFLVGVIMGYQGAVLLRQVGADIFVADFVGLAMVREMGAMMAGIVMAGRTGAAFAAELGNMKANEEIDALETFGFDPVQFLVLPRLAALTLALPLLALYANFLGIFGGMLVAAIVLDLPPIAYWIQLTGAVDASDLATGLIKSVVFGVLVGVAGCLRGLQAARSAAGVGAAVTSAVVTAIVFIIVADAIFAVLFNILGL